MFDADRPGYDPGAGKTGDVGGWTLDAPGEIRDGASGVGTGWISCNSRARCRAWCGSSWVCQLKADDLKWFLIHRSNAGMLDFVAGRGMDSGGSVKSLLWHEHGSSDSGSH